MKPAMTATSVLMIPVMTAVFTMSSFWLRCEESVIITPKPSDNAKKTCPKTSRRSFGVIFEKSGMR